MFVSVPFSQVNPAPSKCSFCADKLYRESYHRIVRQARNAEKLQFLVSLAFGAKCVFTSESSLLGSRAVINPAVVPDVQPRRRSRVASLSGITATAPSLVQPSSAGMGLF